MCNFATDATSHAAYPLKVIPHVPATLISSSHSAFLTEISSEKEPVYYYQACQSKEWVDAMNAELKALEDNQTWELMALPPGKKAIGCKWVYKIKRNPDGSIERYKARLVAKGFNQVEGVDYFDSFSPVAKLVTVRMLITIATMHGWELHQLDVNNAFLHGYLNDEVYMKVPQGYQGSTDGQVCKLKCSLYGLKQASREWNNELRFTLYNFGLTQSQYDHCLFTMNVDDGFLAMIVYVDDVLITGSSSVLIQKLKHFLDDKFTIKDLHLAKFFLGVEITRDPKGTSLCQRKYILDILADVGMQGCKPAPTPLPHGVSLFAEDGVLLDTPDQFRRLIGRLLYLSMTRPDVTYAVQQLSQFVQAPRSSHWEAAMHVLRYLKGTPSLGLYYPASNSSVLSAFSDADWAACKDTRRSITGYCVFLGCSLIAWKSKKQTTVSRSSAEAEYRALASTACELRWVKNIISDFQVTVPLPIDLHCDNRAAIHITANPVFHERTKHLEIDCHIVCDLYKAGFLLPLFVRSKSNLADFFMKTLTGSSFTMFISKLGMADAYHAPP